MRKAGIVQVLLITVIGSAGAFVIGMSSNRVAAAQAATSDGDQGAARRRPIDLRNDLLYADLLVHEGTRFAAYADGRNVRVILATGIGALDAVIKRVSEVGGQVELSDREMGYVRAIVPLRAWVTIRHFEGVVAADIDGLVEPWWTERDVAPKAFTWGGPAINTAAADELIRRQSSEIPSRHRPMPSHDVLGLSRLWTEHPTFDGRGVGIAIIEPGASSIPLDHPAFSLALDRDGRRIAKVAAILMFGSSSRQVAAIETFIARETHAYTRDGVVRVPQAGTYHLGRAGLPTGATSVLWNATTGEVRFDTNHDLDYTNDQPLQDLVPAGSRPSTWGNSASFG